MSAAPARMNPFPGLRPFTPEEDYVFFGREEQTRELLERLFFAAEEEVVLFRGEGSQPGERVRLGRRGTHVLTSLIRVTKRVSSALGSNAPGWRITSAWWE